MLSSFKVYLFLEAHELRLQKNITFPLKQLGPSKGTGLREQITRGGKVVRPETPLLSPESPTLGFSP